MAQNVTYLGANYASVPQVILPKTGGGSAVFTDLSGTTAVAADVATGKTFYLADGQAATGTANTSLVPFAIRPDAELVHTVTWDQMLVEDLGVTIPSYSTTSKTLRDSQVIGTYAANRSLYDYIVVLRTLLIPVYSITTKAKGREKYTFTSNVYEMCNIDTNALPALIDPTKKVAGASNPVPAQSITREVYWSSASAVAAYTSASYGFAVTVAAPSWSSNTLQINSGSITIRGHATYFTNTFYNALTDARVQVKADIYRAPIGNMNVDAWSSQQNINRLIQTVSSETHDLL